MAPTAAEAATILNLSLIAVLRITRVMEENKADESRCHFYPRQQVQLSHREKHYLSKRTHRVNSLILCGIIHEQEDPFHGQWPYPFELQTRISYSSYRPNFPKLTALGPTPVVSVAYHV